MSLGGNPGAHRVRACPGAGEVVPSGAGFSDTHRVCVSPGVGGSWVVDEAGEAGRGLMMMSQERSDDRLRLCLLGSLGAI